MKLNSDRNEPNCSLHYSGHTVPVFTIDFSQARLHIELNTDENEAVRHRLTVFIIA